MDEFSVVVWNEVQPRADEEKAYQREMEAYRALEVRSSVSALLLAVFCDKGEVAKGRLKPDSFSFLAFSQFEPDSDSDDSDEDEPPEDDEDGEDSQGSKRKRRRTNSVSVDLSASSSSYTDGPSILPHSR